jgi:hypothetical protein
MAVEPPSLEGCRQKQRRGMKHLEDLDAAIAEWVGVEAKPYAIAGRFDTQRREYVVTGKIVKPLDDLLLWGVMFGDALHNFRSALDHLVWQLVRLDSGNDGTADNQFPICSTGASYWSIGKNGRPSTRDRTLHGVSDAHKALIDQMQPYRTPTQPGSSLAALNVLRDLANHDKHRLVHLTMLAVDFRSREELDAIFEANADAGERIGTKFAPFPRDGDAEILAIEFSCPGPDPQVSMKGQPTLGIGVSESRARLEHFTDLGVEVGQIIEVFADDFPS